MIATIKSLNIKKNLKKLNWGNRDELVKKVQGQGGNGVCTRTAIDMYVQHPQITPTSLHVTVPI